MITRSHSVFNLSKVDFYYDSIKQYKPWYSQHYYNPPLDDLFYYRYYYGIRFYPYQYHRARRYLDLAEPGYSHFYAKRYRAVSLYDTDPLYYRRGYYSRYFTYPFRHSMTAPYYESKLYDTTPFRPFDSYYPRPYYHYYMY